MTVERRVHARVPFAGRAYLTYDGRCRAEEVVNLSREGLQLHSGARLRPGKPVKVFLPLPHEGGFRLCLLKGEVVRRVRGREASLGIALLPGETDTRALLAEYVTAAA
ncbi:MAG: PilZ domain-containing protein [Myxococcales bacterium]|nr:PilZ domain-containing protein [Myxococcales bacterium]